MIGNSNYFFPPSGTSTPVALALLLLTMGNVFGDDAAVSWYRDINPLFKRSCNGCHNPNKLKGEVDTSTYTGFLKGGKHGPNFVAGDPTKSRVIEEISGKEPSMPKEGDPLSPLETALIEKWIKEGAKDDTPADAYSTKLAQPPTYIAPPVIAAIAFSSNSNWLAVAGYHEVLLFDAPTLTLKARLLGESPRIDSLAFSPDSKLLGVSGGAPSRFGEIQVWDLASTNIVHSWKLGGDSIFGLSWSPDGSRLAFGGPDKVIHVIGATNGAELMKFDNHSDWTLRTAWMADGRRLLSASRDRAMKLIDANTGQFIDDINKLLEPIVCMARHPKEEWAAYGGAEGGVRIYKAKENQERTAGNNDVNLVRDFERQPGPVHAIAWSPDGSLLAVGGVGGEVRVYKSADGARAATLEGHDGAVFTLQFSPDGKLLFTAGFDGLVRGFNPSNGRLQVIFTPIRIEPRKEVAAKG
jgi:WD40 repeat protein